MKFAISLLVTLVIAGIVAGMVFSPAFFEVARIVIISFLSLLGFAIVLYAVHAFLWGDSE